MWRPAGSHTGLTFSAALSVTGTGVPPTAGTRTMALGPLLPNPATPTANGSLPETSASHRPSGDPHSLAWSPDEREPPPVGRPGERVGVGHQCDEAGGPAIGRRHIDRFGPFGDAESPRRANG